MSLVLLFTVVSLFYLGGATFGAVAAQEPTDTDFARRVDRALTVADSLRKVGQADSALALISPFLNEAHAAWDSLQQIRLLGQKGRILKQSGRAREAEPVFAKAAALAEAVKDSVTLAGMLFQWAQAADAQGRPPRAVPLYEKSITVSEASSEKMHAARSRLMLARRLLRSGELEEARAKIESALTTMRRFDDEVGQYSAFFALGIVADKMGDHSQARSCWLESLAWARLTGNDRMIGNCLNNLARQEMSLGDPGSATERWLEAYRLLKDKGRLRAATVPAANAAIALRELGRYDEAIALLEEQLAVCRAQSYSDYEAGALINLGEIARSQGRNQNATRSYREALALVRGTNQVGYWVDALNGLTQALAAMDSSSAALAILLGETGELRTRVSLEKQSLIDHLTAEMLIRVGRPAEALPILAQSLATSVRLGRDQMLLRTLPLSAQAYRALSKPDSAVACLERGVAVWERCREVPMDPTWRENRGAAGVLVYTQLADLLLDHPASRDSLERIQRTFDILQRFKSRTLLERMLGPGGGAVDSLIAGIDLANLHRVQHEGLKSGELFLDVFVGPHHAFLFAVTTEECRVVRLPGQDTGLGSKLSLYRELMVGPPTGGQHSDDLADIRTTSATISRLILSEIGDLLPAHPHVFYAPDGPLNMIPLGGLFLEKLSGPAQQSSTLQPLMTRCDIVRVPSATLLCRMRDRTKKVLSRNPDRVLAVAGWETDSGVPLEGAMREVRLLGRRYENVDVWLGGVSEPRSPSAEHLMAFDVLHFAAHTSVDDQHPWRSCIFLDRASVSDSLAAEHRVGESAKGEPLRASRIAALDLPARLVVLSGCESAGGRVLSGEGVLGLTSAFLSAGVPTVVASLWPVDDQTTARLMHMFYELMAEGASAKSALRQSQLQLFQESTTSHPFYWAGFVLVGDGDLHLKLLKRRGVAFGPGVILAVAVGILMLLVLVRRKSKPIEK